MIPSWKTKLKSKLKQLKVQKNNISVVFLGIGSELNADDAAGVLICRQLVALFSENGIDPAQFQAVDCGNVPENFSGYLRKIKPDFILMIDAGAFSSGSNHSVSRPESAFALSPEIVLTQSNETKGNTPPGTIDYFNWQEIEGIEVSTHSLPLSVFASYIEKELGCEIGLLLVQPHSVDFLGEIHPDVCIAIDAIITFLMQIAD